MSPSADRPTHPWKPATLKVSGVYKRTPSVWVTDQRTGDRTRRKVVRFDVRYRVDGYQFSYTFEQRGWADSFAKRLQEAFAEGKLFDPDSRQFTDAVEADAAKQQALSFFDVAVEYINRKWRNWEPASRRNAQRDIARACVLLVRDNAPALTTDERAAVDRWLRDDALMPDATAHADGGWSDWFKRWSLPLTDITDVHLHAYIEHIRSYDLIGKPRQLASSCVRRARAVTRAVFTHAHKRRLLDWDPWDAVEPEHDTADGIDPDLVMSPAQVRALAAACAAIRPATPRSCSPKGCAACDPEKPRRCGAATFGSLLHEVPRSLRAPRTRPCPPSSSLRGKSVGAHSKAAASTANARSPSPQNSCTHCVET